MNKQFYFILSIIALVVLVVAPVHAVTTYYESTSLGRIVGDSPNDLIRQMRGESIIISDATAYPAYEEGSQNNLYNILEVQYGESNVNPVAADLSLYPHFGLIEDGVTEIKDNELIVVDVWGKNDPLNLLVGPEVFSQSLSPGELSTWEDEFYSHNPLLILDAEYAGAYVPGEDTFVGRLGPHSTMIAPQSFSSSEFVDSFLCNMYTGKTVGEVYRDARNMYYNGESQVSRDNLPGLVLQSYSLYGNPNQEITMPYNDVNDLKSYCKNYLHNLAPDVEFVEQIGDYAKFKRHVVMSIPEYTIEDQGDYQLIEAKPAYTSTSNYELGLPMAIRTTYFPKNTIITDYEVTFIGDPVEITLEDLPSYENGFVERVCYENTQDYSITFSDSYTDSEHNVVAEIHPVEVIDCEKGLFKLYKQINYSIDYITLSPVKIEEVSGPSSALPGSAINLEINLVDLSTITKEFTIAVFDSNNKIVSSKDITNDIETLNLEFTTGDSYGLETYSVEVLIDSQTVAYQDYPLFIEIVETTANIPESARGNVNLDFNFHSYKESPFDLDARFYLINNNEVLQKEEYSVSAKKGDNFKTIQFTNLLRDKQSYSVIVEQRMMGEIKTDTFLLLSDNAPLLVISEINSVPAGEKIIINYEATDLDLDSLTVSINDSRLIKNGNSFEWQTDENDIGTYVVNIIVNDGKLTNDKIVSFTILEPALESPSTPNKITCDTQDCDGIYSNSITLQCSGSTDNKGNTLDYTLEYKDSSIIPSAKLNLSEGLVSYYSFDVDSNDELSRNNLQNDGVSTAPGKVSNAFDFTKNINSKVWTSNDVSFDRGSEEYTLGAWFNMDSNSGDSSTIVMDRATTGNYHSYNVNVNRDNNIAFSSWSNPTVYLKGSTFIETDRWYHVVVSVTKDTATIYLDGKIELEAPIVSGSTPGDGLAIGAWRGNTWEETNFFNGRIDEVGIWSRSLSTEEVTFLYANGNGRSSDDFIQTDSSSLWNSAGSHTQGSSVNWDVANLKDKNIDLRCKANNDAGDSQYYALSNSISIIDPDTQNPKFTNTPEDINLVEGNPLEYQINATDNKGEVLYKINNTKFTISENGLLSIPNNVPSGIYPLLITISDKAGNSISDEIIITIIEPLAKPSTPNKITCDSQDCSGEYSNSILLQCSGSTDNKGNTLDYTIEYTDNSPGSTSLTNDLVSYYTFDDNLEDSHNSIHGNVIGDVVYTDGISGDSVSFDKNVNHIVYPNANEHQLGDTDFTVSFWINPKDITSEIQTVISKKLGNGQNDYSFYMFKDRIDFMMTFGDSRGENCYSDLKVKSSPLKTDEWYHIVGIFDGKNKNMKLLVNGVEQESKATSTGYSCYSWPAARGPIPLYLGSNHFGNPDYSGKIDELGLWSRTLTDDEIISLYNSGEGRSYNTTDSSWTLIGSQQEGSTVNWDISELKNENIGLRCNAVNDAGNSEYYTLDNQISIIKPDTEKPKLTDVLEDLSLTEGESLVYQINATDNRGIVSYRINNTKFTISTKGLLNIPNTLDTGIYPLKITISDKAGNSILDEIIITVIEALKKPTTPNKITCDSKDCSADYIGSINLQCSGSTDNKGNTLDYTLEYNLENSAWKIINEHKESSSIDWNISAIAEGEISLRCSSYNNAGSSTEYTLDSKIQNIHKDVTSPTFNDFPPSQSIKVFDAFSLQIEATDKNGIQEYLVNDSRFSISDNGLLTNNSILIPDGYTISISAYDPSGNIISEELNIRISKITPEFQFYINGKTQGAEIYTNEVLNLTIVSNKGENNVSLHRVDRDTEETVLLGSTNNMLTHFYNTDNADTFDIIAFSPSTQNYSTKVIKYTISIEKAPDNISPEIHSLDTIIDINYAEGLMYPINATDNIGVSSFTVNDTRFSISNDGTLKNATLLNAGEYPLTIIASDSSGNTVTENTVIRYNKLAPKIELSIINGKTSDITTDDTITIKTTLEALEGKINLGIKDESFITDFIEPIASSSSEITYVFRPKKEGNFTFIVNFVKTDNYLEGSKKLSIEVITPIDNIKPEFEDNLGILLMSQSEPISFKIRATDNIEVDRFEVNDTRFSISKIGRLRNETILSGGLIPLIVTVYDTSDNKNSMSFVLSLMQTCNTNNDCSDNLYCNGEETCNQGYCSAGAPIQVDDSLSCTTDTCNEDTDSISHIYDEIEPSKTVTTTELMTISGPESIDDTYIISWIKRRTFGTHPFVKVGNTVLARRIQRGLFSFNISEIPEDHEIINASLRLYMASTYENANTTNHSLHLIKNTWIESSYVSRLVNRNNNATSWFYQWHTNPWNNSGVDYINKSSFTLEVDDVGYYRFDVT
ncbi:MAG: hypothetical protein ACI83O_000820, partial [Patescibacteria group bacterium]